uniref:Sigma70_r3 domain-containing protein n=1 Tax=Macrostomum lignano TaxID=282301 RepID=A0A1I8GRG2_9PLAT
MALSKEKQRRISDVVEMTTSLLKKDRSLLGARLRDFPNEELMRLQASLQKLNGLPDKRKSVSEKKEENRQEETVIEKIKEKLEDIEDRGVRVSLQSLFSSINFVGEKLFDLSRTSIIEGTKQVIVGIDNVSILKAILQFEFGRRVNYLSSKFGMDERELARVFDVTIRKVSDYVKYYRLCLEFPGLIFSGYSMGRVLNYSAPIRKKAATDTRFDQLLRMQHESVAFLTMEGEFEKTIQAWYEDEANEEDDEDEDEDKKVKTC